jgi:hypothetical protein
MGIQTRDIEIRGVSFKVTQLTPMRSLKLLNRLGKVLGPALARAGAAVGKGGGLDILQADIDFGELGQALAALFSELADDAQFEYLMRNLLSGAVVIGHEGKVQPLFGGDGHGSSAVFDAVFAEHPADAYKLALFALEVNYADFSDAIAGIKARVMAALAAKASGTSASGTSTT